MVNAGLAASGAVLGATQVFAENGQGRAEREVLAVVSRYGRKTARTEGKEGVKITVKMRSQEAFNRVFRVEGAPFTRIFASGNTLTFKHLGVPFQLENIS